MIYNLSFTEDQFRKIKQLLYEKTVVVPEIELRFKSTNNERIFNLLISKIGATSGILQTIDSEDTVYNKKNLRKIKGANGKLMYEQKDKSNIDVDVIDDFTKATRTTIRFSRGSEQPIEKDVFEKSAESILVRHRKRKTFVFDQFVFDLTRVTTSDKKVLYEIEAELNRDFVIKVRKGGPATFTEVIGVVKKICGIYFFTFHTLFSAEMHGTIRPPIDQLFKLIEKALRPKNIDLDDCRSGLMNYAITNKLDGTGYQFFMLLENDSTMLAFYLKNNSEIWKLGHVSHAKIDVAIKSIVDLYINMVFDVEFFDHSIYCFDVVYSRDGLHERPLLERLNGLTNFFQKLNDLFQTNAFLKQFTFRIKKFFSSGSVSADVSNVLKEMREQFGEIDLLKHNDGVVFQSMGPYHPKNAIYKWKFFNNVTIDFLFDVKQTTPSETVYWLKILFDKNDYRPFKDHHNNELIMTINNETYYDGIKGDKLKGFVIEVGRQNKQLVIHRIRFDKRPENTNYIKTARDTWKDMIEELTLARVVREIENARSAKPSAAGAKKTVEEQKLPDRNRQKDESGAKLLVNFILLNSISVGNKQEYFNLRDEITIINMNGFMGVSTIEFSKAFHKVTTFVRTDEEYRINTENVRRHNLKNVVIVMIDRETNIFDYYADVIFADNLGYKLSDITVDKLKKNCHLLVMRIDGNITTEMIDLHYNPSFCLESEIIDGYKFISIFTSPSIFKYHKNIDQVKIQRTCLEVFREQYNKAKRRLINEYSKDRVVLDIGFGKGGDIDKYVRSNTKELFGIEPNREYTDEFFKKRSGTHRDWIQKNVKIINTTGQDIEQIHKFLGGRKMDTINMFFSLSFFYKTQQDLRNLARTIGTTLSENGHFVGGYLDGNKIQDRLTSEFMNKRIIQTCYEIIGVNVDSEKRFNQEIIFNMKESNTATTQTEYLIYLEELERELAVYDIYLVDKMDSERMVDFSVLDVMERQLAQYYSFFVFRKGYDEIIQTPIISPVLIGETNLYRLPARSDGNCFVDSVLTCLHAKLSTLENIESLRAHLASNFTIETYESLGGGLFSILYFREKITEYVTAKFLHECFNKNISGELEVKINKLLEQTFSETNINAYIESLVVELADELGEEAVDILRGIHVMNYMECSSNIRTSGVWTESWMIPYIEQQLNINIYIVYNQTRKIVKLSDKTRDSGLVNILLINNNNVHFEPLAKVVEGEYVTVYSEKEIASLF